MLLCHNVQVALTTPLEYRERVFSGDTMHGAVADTDWRALGVGRDTLCERSGEPSLAVLRVGHADHSCLDELVPVGHLDGG